VVAEGRDRAAQPIEPSGKACASGHAAIECPTPFLATRAGRLTKGTEVVAARDNAGCSRDNNNVRSTRGERAIMKNLINRFVREDAGQDLIEYALLAGLIALVCVATITLAGTKVSTLFTNVTNAIP
jgi:pilus assembly protein Flp/PilA